MKLKHPITHMLRKDMEGLIAPLIHKFCTYPLCDWNMFKIIGEMTYSDDRIRWVYERNKPMLEYLDEEEESEIKMSVELKTAIIKTDQFDIFFHYTKRQTELFFAIEWKGTFFYDCGRYNSPKIFYAMRKICKTNNMVMMDDISNNVHPANACSSLVNRFIHDEHFFCRSFFCMLMYRSITASQSELFISSLVLLAADPTFEFQEELMEEVKKKTKKLFLTKYPLVLCALFQVGAIKNNTKWVHNYFQANVTTTDKANHQLFLQLIKSVQ